MTLGDKEAFLKLQKNYYASVRHRKKCLTEMYRIILRQMQKNVRYRLKHVPVTADYKEELAHDLSSYVIELYRTGVEARKGGKMSGDEVLIPYVIKEPDAALWEISRRVFRHTKADKELSLPDE